jgi:phosphotransferase system IIB component
MITNNQIRSLTEDELSYLYYCLNTEWNSLNMPYEMNLNTMKAFRNNSIQVILNKHSSNLKDENKKIVLDILNKLEQNY